MTSLEDFARYIAENIRQDMTRADEHPYDGEGLADIASWIEREASEWVDTAGRSVI
ncbi:MAG: hypothetical protein GY906_35640 [bacterium]|nr:hypothetical protein [bacterium]